MANWGGHVSHARSANGRAKMNWQLGQERAVRFLRDIRHTLRQIVNVKGE